MDFQKIINTTSSLEKDKLLNQVLKRQEYNRQYQRKLRERSKLVTLEKKIDDNLNFVIGYIKRKYAEEYAAWVEPVEIAEVVVTTNQPFLDWFVLAAQEYKSIKEAYQLSGLDNSMTFEEFEELFNQRFKQNDKGKYTQY